MADAYCGPSNALQNFQKHSSVDRTLQQDRLTSRRFPLENFRSAELHAGALDPEFEAFQASQPGPLPFAEPAGLPFQQSLNQRGKQPVFGGAPGAVDWASDFQRLHVSPVPHQQRHAPPPTQLRHSPAIPQNQTSAAPSQYQFTSAISSQPFQAQYGRFGGSGGYGQGMMQQNMAVQAPQAPTTVVSEFDDEAFARAFDAAREDILSHETGASTHDTFGNTSSATLQPDPYPHLSMLRLAMATMLLNPTEQNMHKAALFLTLLEQHDANQITSLQSRLFLPILSAMAEAEHVPYAERYDLRNRANILHANLSSLPSWSDFSQDDVTRTQRAAEYYDRRFEAYRNEHQTPTATTSSAKDEDMRDDISMQVRNVMSLDHAHRLADTLPSNFQELLQPLAEAGVLDAEADFTSQNMNLAPQVDLSSIAALSPWQKLSRYAQLDARTTGQMPMTDGLSWGNDADLLRNAPLEPEMAQQREDQQHHDENDELARTANELLEKVQNNQSDKFQNSAFLNLMRRLRDHEVKVEGDKMVETGMASATVESAGPGIAAQTEAAPLQRKATGGPWPTKNGLQWGSSQPQPAITTSKDVGDQALRDGEDVVRLLDEPATLDQDPEFMMTSPFYDNEHAQLGRQGLWQDYEHDE